MKRGTLLKIGITLLLTGAAGMDSEKRMLPVLLIVLGIILAETGLRKGVEE